ncbi:HWE histidine kinase domain-containing protein [Reyranella sp.]|uniref:HWE histidine kinase domain-containing protein n=1 Tax=Reyranella sp. TaxID=1929291 RepID=UPI0027308238|nr:HWE histidine kinase domain-containing protein [Reyranella sp.]MDP2372258.1 HWE histidine kinase domain-containing protein [Reyranella sp.]
MIKKSAGQKAAEAEVKEFRDDLGPFVVAAETTRMAMVFTDATAPENPIIFANDSFLALTGYERPEVLGKSFNFLLAHAADAEGQAAIDAEFSGKSECGCELQYRRKDGSTFWVGLFVSPVRDEQGKIVQYFVSFVDLSALKAQQAQSLALIDELNHRVKNTLAVVQSIVWQALRSTPDPKAAREAIESRLFALSRSHDLLTREDWKGAGLRQVIGDALQPFTGADPDRIGLIGEDVRFPPRTALALSVVFHELGTNALKYGAWSNATGKVRIEWTTRDGPGGSHLVLKWQETGGPLVTPPSHRGFGSNAIERGLTHELGAEVALDYRPEGVVCTIDVPVPDGNPPDGDPSHGNPVG